jgi:type 1 fimbria pilin
MEWFYLTVLAIAILLLIIMLTFIGTRITKNEKSGNTSNNVFPPVQNTCPDLWEATQEDDIIQCNIPTDKNIGILKDSDGAINELTAGEIIGLNTDKDAIDFSSYETECDKKKWADKYNIKWDGISNYNQC